MASEIAENRIEKLRDELSRVFANYPTAVDRDGNIVEISPEKAFERVSPAAHKEHLSGNKSYQNACATRLSLAFEAAGIKIPRGYDGLISANGNRIIISAVQMNRFMTDRYGDLMTPFSRQTSTNGIYIGVAKPGVGFSGHVTIIRPGFVSLTLESAMQTMNFWSIP